MNIKALLSMMIAGMTGLLLLSAAANAAEGGPQDMQFAANCKVEGADGERCQTAHKVMEAVSGR